VSLHRAAHVRAVEAGQDAQDLQPRHRVLALQAAQQLRHAVLVDDLADDLEQRGLLVRFLRVGGGEQLAHAEAGAVRADHLEDGRLGDAGPRQGLEQQVRGEAAAAGERPGHAGDDARAALDQGLDVHRDRLGRGHAGEHVDQRNRGLLVGIRQCSKHRLDGGGAELLEPGDRLLGLGTQHVLGGLDLVDEAIGAEVVEKSHLPPDYAMSGRTTCDAGRVSGRPTEQARILRPKSGTASHFSP